MSPRSLYPPAAVPAPESPPEELPKSTMIWNSEEEKRDFYERRALYDRIDAIANGFVSLKRCENTKEGRILAAKKNPDVIMKLFGAPLTD